MPKFKMTTNPNELSKTLQNLNIVENDSIADDSTSNQNLSNNIQPSNNKETKGNTVISNQQIINDSKSNQIPSIDIVVNDSNHNRMINNDIKAKDIFVRPSKELRQRFNNYQESVANGGMKLIQNTYICSLLDKDLIEKGF
jgi:hypothetical protein